MRYDTIEKIRMASLYSNLIPIKFVQPNFNKKGYPLPRIECKCICGKVVEIDMYHFVNGRIKSCGCLVIEKCKELFTKYPGNIKEIRASYDCMIRRCYDEICEEFKWYGGRGVKVCDEWRNDYKLFLKWAKENGWQKGLCIDKDKLGNGLLYSPQTCCWITQAENMKYTRSAILYHYNGMDRTLTEIGRIIGRKPDTLRRSLSAGLTLHQAINKPNYQRIK